MFTGKFFFGCGRQGWIWKGNHCPANCLDLVWISVLCGFFLPQSSLLQCLLGELKALRGSVEVEGRISYASQTPWVFSGTVKENILFGSELDDDRYTKVIEACGLKQVNE